MNAKESKQSAYSATPEEREVAKRVFSEFKRAYDAGHESYMARARKCANYYEGEQWSEADRAKLEDDGRPALTINQILPTVNTVLGEQSMNRMELLVKPRGDSDQQLADTLTKLFMQINDHCDLDTKESEVFADGLIEERGYFDCRIDFDGNIHGEVDIEVPDPKDIVLDPEAKNYDPKTWTKVWRTRLMSLDEIELTYGKAKAERLKHIGLNEGSSFGRHSFIYDEDKFGGEENGMYHIADEEDQKTRKTIRFVRVIEEQCKKVHYGQCFIDYETGDTSPVPETWGVDKVESFRMKFGLGLIKKIQNRIRWTVISDCVVLHDDWSPYKTFTLIPYFPFFRRGRPFGLVTNLLSPQDQVNKTSSQELHIVNTTANSGWTVEEGTLTNMTEDDLAEKGAQTGLVLVHARGSNAPQKIQPNQIPSGLDRIGMKGAAAIREISGVNEGMLGIGSAEVSGVALQRKEARGQVQIQVPLDHLARTRKLLAYKLLELVQQFYTDARVYRIVDDRHPDQPEIEIALNQEQPDGSILNDLSIGEYDITIGTQPARGNFGDVQFAQAVELRNAGIAIPDHVVIEYSNLARKKDIAEQVKQLAGLAPPSEEELQLMQMQQQLAINTLQAELDKLVAEAEEIRSRSLLNEAKAEQAGGDIATRLKDIDAKVMSKREELSVRLQLAQMTNRVKQQGLGAQMLMSLQQPKQQSTPEKKGK